MKRKNNRTNINKNKVIRNIPKKLMAKYTLDGKIPVIKWVFNDISNSNTTRVLTMQEYKIVFWQLEYNLFNYYGETLTFLLNALKKYSIKGKTVCVFGSTGVNCDAISLVNGAEKVYIIEYNPLISEHPLVEAYNYKTFQEKNIKVDVGISISSFEHDGLGRYGDRLNPNGDLKTMKKIKKIIKKNGLLFLSVPVGPDCLVWNAHRIYGKYRLPMLLNDWEFLEVFSDDSITVDGEPIAYPTKEPVFVLKNI